LENWKESQNQNRPMLLTKIHGVCTTIEFTGFASTKMCFKTVLDGTYVTPFDAALASFSTLKTLTMQLPDKVFFIKLMEVKLR
jgi:hypothetical protein